jgi:hypothetical protein
MKKCAHKHLENLTLSTLTLKTDTLSTLTLGVSTVFPSRRRLSERSPRPR